VNSIQLTSLQSSWRVKRVFFCKPKMTHFLHVLGFVFVFFVVAGCWSLSLSLMVTFALHRWSLEVTFVVAVVLVIAFSFFVISFSLLVVSVPTLLSLSLQMCCSSSCVHLQLHRWFVLPTFLLHR